MNQGLTQRGRAERISSMEHFHPVDSSKVALLARMIDIASFVRFHDENDSTAAYFDAMLDDLRKLHQESVDGITPFDGDFEPAQALLYAVADALHGVLSRFNERWSTFPNWYIDHVLQVEGQRPQADQTYIQFEKGVPGKILIPQGTAVISSQRGTGAPVRFLTSSALPINDIVLGRIVKSQLSHEQNVYPANVLRAPTAVMVADISHRNAAVSSIFPSVETREKKQPIGLQVSSPALLLREGRRHVDIAFEADNSHQGANPWAEGGWLYQILTGKLNSEDEKTRNFSDLDLKKVFSHVFHLELSTVSGWTTIPNHTFELAEDKLAFTIKFDLNEHFPETCPCDSAIHGHRSTHPALKILLNKGAWLYPQIWLEKFFLSRITLYTRVKDVTDVQVYNELGKVDNSVPFAPFGINNERGAWFVVGNYEMAAKNTYAIDLSVTWQQIPMEEDGLAGYYKGYPAPVTNTSFKLKARYLSDYRWISINMNDPLSLFMTDNGKKGSDLRPIGRVSEESVWRGIPLHEMRPVTELEQEYEYGIRAKRGFVSFVLDSPEMGLGGKTYRNLFTELITRNALKRKKVHTINPPISPLIQRLLLSYEAKDVINVSNPSPGDGASLHHIYPLGIQQIYPLKGSHHVPFVYSLPANYNLMFELKGEVESNDYQVYLEFVPQQKDIGLEDLPEISWYWGNGYYWESVPTGVIQLNSTRNFMVSGLLAFRFAEYPTEEVRHDGESLWICASITRNYESIPLLRRIVPHVVRVQREEQELDKILPEGYTLDTARIPGITKVSQASSFFGRIEPETAKEKLARVSEYIAHRGRAVTPRDYERLVLQHFKAVRQAMCVPCFNSREAGFQQQRSPGVVTIVVFPQRERVISENNDYRYCPPDLLYDIQQFLLPRASLYVKRVSVVNALYEEIIVRARVVYRAGVDEMVANEDVVKRVNEVIAPWITSGNAPYLGYSFAMSDLDEAIRLPIVSELELTVYQLIHVEGNDFQLKKYGSLDDRVTPSARHGVMIPAKRHVIGHVTENIFGIEEMSIDQNFVIYGEEE